ncbi:hypothetical protein A6M21_10035 [Desulfotomaculum copahuensis]|uniref:Uncharacterized protein n=1 Tax=Desulfotomaculum copahuensis TaxID=1838280 RepID=A0A1B7LES8_9FIRM|nr:hypothetical protein A6M21_10035 [Desulfotomaculum copahuensis]
MFCSKYSVNKLPTVRPSRHNPPVSSCCLPSWRAHGGDAIRRDFLLQIRRNNTGFIYERHKIAGEQAKTTLQLSWEQKTAPAGRSSVNHCLHKPDNSTGPPVSGQVFMIIDKFKIILNGV